MKSVLKKRCYPKKCKRVVSSRNFNIHYFVKCNGQDVRVCKEEFLAVHGLQRSQKRIQLLCKQIGEGSSTPSSDKRGKHLNRTNKISNETYQSIKLHIDSIPKYTSHYSRNKNPKKVYLDHDLSISSLYRKYYVPWCQDKNISPASEDKYRRVFSTEYNIGFKLPKSDTCKICDSLPIQIQDPSRTDKEKKAFQIQLELHQRRAEAMQQNLKAETANAQSSTDLCVISFDLQQALPVPNLSVGPAFYLKKAWVYNLGIHDCGTNKGYMYMWSENTAKRGSDEIASILYKHFTENKTGAKTLIVFSDNCTGQNKNWSVICLWRNLVKEGIFQSVEHRFLTVGHTHLPSDRDFANIEKYKRHYLKTVYTPEDWYKAVKDCRVTNPFKVVVIQQKDVLCFKDIQSQITRKTLTDQKEKISFGKICCLKFEQENYNIMLIKHIFNEPFKPTNIVKRGQRSSTELAVKDLKQKYKQPIPLNPKKIENISQLLPYIPPAYMDFYTQIGANSQTTRVQVNESNHTDHEIEELDNFSDLNESDNDNN